MYMDSLIKADERVGNFPEKFCGLGFCILDSPFWNGAWTTKSSSNLGMVLQQKGPSHTNSWELYNCTTSQIRKTKKTANLLGSQLVFQKEKIHQDTATHCHSDFDLPQCPPWHPWNPWLSTMDVSQSEGANGSARVFVKTTIISTARIKNRNKNQFEKGLLMIFCIWNSNIFNKQFENGNPFSDSVHVGIWNLPFTNMWECLSR